MSELQQANNPLRPQELDAQACLMRNARSLNEIMENLNDVAEPFIEAFPGFKPFEEETCAPDEKVLFDQVEEEIIEEQEEIIEEEPAMIFSAEPLEKMSPANEQKSTVEEIFIQEESPVKERTKSTENILVWNFPPPLKKKK